MVDIIIYTNFTEHFPEANVVGNTSTCVDIGFLTYSLTFMNDTVYNDF